MPGKLSPLSVTLYQCPPCQYFGLIEDFQLFGGFRICPNCNARLKQIELPELPGLDHDTTD